MIQKILAVIRVFAPKLAKLAGPELSRWLAKSKNRQQATETLKRLASLKPGERLIARIELAELVFKQLSSDSELSSERRALGQAGLDELQVLRTRLSLPLGSLRARVANRRAVGASLDAILKRTDDAL